MATWLSSEKGVADTESHLIASMANGSLAKALAICDEDLKGRRDRLISRIASLPDMQIRSQLALALALANGKVHLSDSLEMIKTWLRDLIVAKYSRDKIIYKGLNVQQTGFSTKASLEMLLLKFEAVQSAQNKITANANQRLTLEVMILRLARS